MIIKERTEEVAALFPKVFKNKSEDKLAIREASTGGGRGAVC
jgi:uncharacterized protein (UPF0254 family)